MKENVGLRNVNPGSSTGFIEIFVSLCQLVVCVIPPLLRLGLIDRTESVVLGDIIGMIVAVISIRK